MDLDNEVREMYMTGQSDAEELLRGRVTSALTKAPRTLVWAAQHGHTEFAERLLDRNEDLRAGDDLALHLAALEGNAPTVSLLLARGADPRSLYDCALRMAAMEGRATVVAMLLTQGADPSNHPPDGPCARELAERQGHVSVVAMMDAYVAHAALMRVPPNQEHGSQSGAPSAQPTGLTNHGAGRF